MNYNQSDKYLIMFDVEGLCAGNDFVNWPYHMTIVPYFSIGGMTCDELIGLISGAVDSYGSIEFELGERVVFGLENNVPVTLVSDTNRLISNLHKMLIELLLDHGCVLDDMTYCMDNYRSHISDQSDSPVNNISMKINSITLVKKLANDAVYRKTIVECICL